MRLTATLRDLHVRINMLAGRWRVDGVDAEDATQRLQITLPNLRASGGTPVTYADVEHYEHYGLTAHPPIGAMAVACAPMGEADVILVAGASHPQSRPRGLPDGGVMLYTRANGPNAGVDGAHGVTLAPDDRSIVIRGETITLSADVELRLEVGASSLVLTADSLQAESPNIQLDPTVRTT